VRSAFLRDPWDWSFGFNATLDVCVWALESDGLRVPPFDRHPDGDGALRMAGLTEESWLDWFREVIRLQGDDAAHEAWWRELWAWPRLGGEEGAPRPLPAFLYAPTAWKGAAEVGGLLAALWRRYQVGHNRRHTVDLGEMPARQSVLRRLWRDLKPFHSRMPRLQINRVAYHAAVRYVFRPNAAVLGLSAPNNR
jgi:hypothetical protein